MQATPDFAQSASTGAASAVAAGVSYASTDGELDVDVDDRVSTCSGNSGFNLAEEGGADGLDTDVDSDDEEAMEVNFEGITADVEAKALQSEPWAWLDSDDDIKGVEEPSKSVERAGLEIRFSKAEADAADEDADAWKSEPWEWLSDSDEDEETKAYVDAFEALVQKSYDEAPIRPRFRTIDPEFLRKLTPTELRAPEPHLAGSAMKAILRRRDLAAAAASSTTSAAAAAADIVR